MTLVDLQQAPAVARFGPMGSGASSNLAYQRLWAWENQFSRRHARVARYHRMYWAYKGYQVDDADMPLGTDLYLKRICHAMVSFLWGQWESQRNILTWSITPRVGKGDSRQIDAITRWLHSLFDSYEPVMYDLALNQSIYGDAILRPVWDELEQRVVPTSILPEYYVARWSPHNASVIREAVVGYPIDRNDATQDYGTPGSDKVVMGAHSAQFATYWEHWTPWEYSIWIDDRRIVHQMNPLSTEDRPGSIPMIIIPNIPDPGTLYGESDIEDVVDLVDEIRRVGSDISQTIAVNAHPIVVLTNYFGKADQLPVGPDAIWDLGRDGDAKYLTGGQPPVDSLAYFDKLLNVLYDLAQAPREVFGSSNESITTGLGLTMKLLPLLRRVRWKRMSWRRPLLSYVRLAAHAQAMNGTLPFDPNYLWKVTLDPMFAPFLPRDTSAIIQDNVALVKNGLRSMDRALEDLREEDIPGEVARIQQDMRWKSQLESRFQVGGKNNEGDSGKHAEDAVESQERNKEKNDSMTSGLT